MVFNAIRIKFSKLLSRIGHGCASDHSVCHLDAVTCVLVCDAWLCWPVVFPLGSMMRDVNVFWVFINKSVGVDRTKQLLLADDFLKGVTQYVNFGFR